MSHEVAGSRLRGVRYGRLNVLADSRGSFVEIWRASALGELTAEETGLPGARFPLVKFADGNDPLFDEFKIIIGPTHLTPREALTMAYNKQPEDDGKLVSVVSWVLPIAGQTRKSNRDQKTTPSKPWAYTKWYGEKFNNALRKQIVDTFKIRGYMTTSPVIQPYFKIQSNEKGDYSNWSERHIAYVAGQGTFTLSDGFITEKGSRTAAAA